jgi:hypothetical protein
LIQGEDLLLGSPSPLQSVSASQDQFLEKIERDTFQYFLDYTDHKTGLTRDSSRPGSPVSIAATGFSLASFSVAYSRGWLSYEEAYKKVFRTLATLNHKAQHERGFFYHFLDSKTGKRSWRSEASSIDTALLIAGALVAAQHFKGTPVERMANQIYQRIDWLWMLNGTDWICMGWKPESGFLPYYWDSYNELMILQALAIGSPTHPVPAEIWNGWFRFEEEYNGKRIIYSHTGSLFTYQYSHAFIDFRELNDEGVNYFQNSAHATSANREFCLANSGRFKTYGPRSWGLTACLGPEGYKAYGAEPGLALHDGTVAPSGSAGSIVFTPRISLATLQSFFQTHREKLYGRCGFLDSFNLDRSWWAGEYLGINQGITLLMIENFRTQKIWESFMKLEPIQRWIGLCSLRQANAELRGAPENAPRFS